MKELKEIRAKFHKLGRKLGKYRHLPEHSIHAEFRDVRREYNRAIKYNKWHHWRDWQLKKAMEPDIWTANKYITALASNRGTMRILALRQTTEGVKVTVSMNSN
jgi:hypothetical protein